jgi:hypothetical protein
VIGLGSARRGLTRQGEVFYEDESIILRRHDRQKRRIRRVECSQAMFLEWLKGEKRKAKATQ